MWLSRYLLVFFVFGVIGWVYESIYCTINERKWQNRGFLYGPICPIYGFGFVGMILVIGAFKDQGIPYTPWQVFLFAALGSAVLEYMTSWVLEKLFHARWWDYTNMPFNLNGRICLPATTLFGLFGLLVTYILYEPTISAVGSLDPLLVEALALIATAAISMDTALTVSALTRIASMASEFNESVNAHMERFWDDAFAKQDALAEKARERQEAAAASIAETRANVSAAFAAERERFASALRKRGVDRMSQAVKSAANRIYTVSKPIEGSGSSTEELRALIRELKDSYNGS
ncbi:MAG: putative ABC transporter permease [Atopobiaceae bacterium]|nr:putative ABC transporter permease [Atopobiaceae bacterium]